MSPELVMPQTAVSSAPTASELLHPMAPEDLCLDFLHSVVPSADALPHAGLCKDGLISGGSGGSGGGGAAVMQGGLEPYGRQWGWNADALTVHRNEHTPAPHCSEPWSHHDTLSNLLGGGGGMLDLMTSTLTPDPAPVQASRPPCKRSSKGEAIGRNIRCLVPGCHSDLLTEREFNLRNKICEFHQRSRSLLIEGEEQRFCQQCTRLHPVSAFDGDKRGCRQRLERHNKRRRLAHIITRGLSKQDEEDAAGATSKPEGEGDTTGDKSQSSLVLDACHSESQARDKSDTGSSPCRPQQPQQQPQPVVPPPIMTPPAAPALPSPDQPPPSASPQQVPSTHACRGPGCNLCSAGSRAMAPPATGGAASSVEEFKKSVSFGYDVVEHCVFNFSMKIIGAAPDTLPANLKQELTQWMQASPVAVQGFIRFGCLHLSVDVTMRNSTDMATALRHMPTNFERSVASGYSFPWCRHPTTALFPGERAVTAACGAVVPTPQPQSQPQPQHPVLLDLERLAVADGVLRLRGTGLRRPGVRFMARVNKEFYEMEVIEVTVVDEGSDTAVASLRVPFEAGLGQAWVEVLLDSAEAFRVSQPAALLLTDCPLVAEEVCRLQQRGVERMNCNVVLKLLQDIGALLHPVSGAAVPVATALQIAGFAASCGWPETMDRALERALQAMPLESALDCLEAAHGTSLLSAAVVSGSPATVTRVLAFMAETGSFDLARVDVPSGRLCRSPMQWAEVQGVAEVTELLMALRQQGRALPHRTPSTHSLDRQDGPQMDMDMPDAPNSAMSASGSAPAPTPASANEVAENGGGGGSAVVSVCRFHSCLSLPQFCCHH